MKKGLKIASLCLGAMLLLFLAVSAFTVYALFTPSKLTPIVRSQLPNYLKCSADVEEVELTFFSTFPDFALQLKDVTLVHPVVGVPNDTLMHVDRLIARLDLIALIRQQKVDVKEFQLNKGDVNLFVSELSEVNYDIIVTNGEKEDSETVTLDSMKLCGIVVNDLNVHYLDVPASLEVKVEGFSANLQGKSSLQHANGNVDLSLALSHILVADSSINAEAYGFTLPECQLSASDQVHATMSMRSAIDSLRLFSKTGTKYHLSAGDIELSLPKASVQDGYEFEVIADMATTTFDLQSEGRLVNDLPLSFSGQLKADTLFTDIHLSQAKIKAGKEELLLNAEVQRLDSLTTDADVSLQLMPTTFSRLLSLVPAVYRKSLKGMNIAGSLGMIDAKASLSHTIDQPLDLQSFTVHTQMNDLRYRKGQQMEASLNNLDFEAIYPVENKRMQVLKDEQQVKRRNATKSGRRSRAVKESSFMQARLRGDKVHFEMRDTMNVMADLPHATFNGIFSDEILQDAQSLPFIAADFIFDRITAQADTIDLKSHDLKGSFTMADGMRGMKKYYEASVQCEDISIAMGNEIKTSTGPLMVDASSVYDYQQTDFLSRYNPLLNVTFTDGKVDYSRLPYGLEIPSLDFDFNSGRFLIRDGQVNYGETDFNLKGVITNLGKYLKHEDDLNAELELKSSATNVYQLMDMAEILFPASDTIVVSSTGEETVIDPFIVPEHVNLVLTTHIDQTLVGENLFSNLGGHVEIKDGVLVLEELGFSSKAARMQLTALYKSPKKDNLFVGANFHLLDVEIADLIKMIPEIDTIVPMLRSFDGQAEFHLTAETNLFGNYKVKMSTLKATAAIDGQNLVLLDGDTFSEISKKLMFNKNTRNKIDTLSVEMALNRKKMTLFPMLIGMDKYQAVISGTHDITDAMPFNYHISVTDCPVIGGHLGLDVEGNMEHPEDYSFKLVGCKYASLYKPKKRNITQEQTLELKKLISDALKRTVKEQ